MLSLYFADSTPAGRMNADMLTEQQVFELFFTPDNHEDAHELLEGDENDACSWVGIGCDDDRIENLDWHEVDLVLQGSLNFSIFPRHMKFFNVVGQRLVGEVDLGHLSEELTYFRIRSCAITGTLDIEKLPRNLEYCIVANNSISDIVNVRNLPKNLIELDVQEHGIHKDSLFIGRLPNTSIRINFSFWNIEQIRFENQGDLKNLVLR